MKTGKQLMEEIAEHPTLDRFLDRDPHAIPYTDEELQARVEVMRKERALFNIKGEERKMKRDGLEPTPDDEKETEE